MSAFIVSEAHINTIVTMVASTTGPSSSLTWDSLRHYDTVYPEYCRLVREGVSEADAIGRILWKENYRSVNHRYPDDLADESEVDSYRWQRATQSPVAVLKLCNSLEYQSCEHPGWKDSEAKRILDAIKDHAVRLLPGYDEAKWAL